jgi:translocation and assembly module TamB
VDSLRLDWHLWPLARRRLEIQSVQIAGVDVTTTESREAAVPREVALPDVTLPLRVFVTRAAVRRIAVTVPRADSAYRADSLVADEIEFTDSLVVRRVALVAPALSGDANVTVRPTGTYPIRASLNWTATLRGRRLTGHGEIAGDLERLRLHHTLTDPVPITLEATMLAVTGDLQFDAAATVASFDIRQVDAAYPPARVAAEVSAGGRPMDASAGGLIRIEERRIGTANARVTASRRDSIVGLDSLDIRLAGRPTRIVASGTLMPRAQGAKAELAMRWHRFGWPLIDAPTIEASGRAQVRSSGEQFRFDAATTIAGPRVPAGELRVRGHGGRDGIRFTGEGNVFGGEVRTNGMLTVAPEITWTARVEGHDLDPALLLADSTVAPRELGFIAVTSGRMTPDGPVGRVAVDTLHAVYRSTPLAAQATVQLALDHLTVVLGGELDVAGRIDWRPDARWNLTLTATDLEPASLAPDPSEWPGFLSATLRSVGFLASGGLNIQVDLDTLSGTLRGQPLSGAGRVVYRPAALDVRGAALDWGTLGLRAEAAIDTVLAGRLSLNVPDASSVLPNATGVLSVDLVASGTRAAPAIRGAVLGERLAFASFAADELRAESNVDLAPHGLTELSLVIQNARTAGRQLNNVTLVVSGHRDDHQVDLHLADTALAFRAHAAGTLQQRNWQGRLEHVALDDPQLGAWRLDAPVSLHAGLDSAALDLLCLSGDGRVCIAGEWRRSDSWRAELGVFGLQVSRLVAFTTRDMKASGELNATAAFASTGGGRLEGAFHAEGGPGVLGIRRPQATYEAWYDRAKIDGEIGDGGFRTSWSGALRQSAMTDSTQVQISGALALPDYRAITDSLAVQPLDGRLNVTARDFSALEALIPALVDPAGNFALDVTIDGTVGQPRLLGHARLSEGRVDVPLLGLEVRDVDVSAIGDDAGIRLTGRLRSGPGEVRLDGQASSTIGADSVLQLTVVGEHVVAAATPEVLLRVSPDLRIEVIGSELRAVGDIHVPRATVELKEIPALAIPVSRDAVFIEDTVAARPTQLSARARIRLTFGDSVSFRGFGFTAQPRGSILALEEPDQVTTATGQLTLDGGRYKAYGQDLLIESGRLVFAGGPIDNPGLEVRATRQARDGTIAGLNITGTLREPVVTVFSEPPMLQSDALAYLILGRPLAEASTSEGSRLAGAARSLGLKGGNHLAQRIAVRFGLDEARIEAGSSWEEASLLAGKYLSPRLYVSYSVGLLQATNIFRVRYILSSKWTLQSETGDGTSTDIQYRLERGR